MDTDGVKQGFDLPLLEAVCKVTTLPVIASGGAGVQRTFSGCLRRFPRWMPALPPRWFHYGQVEIPELKRLLAENHILVR